MEQKEVEISDSDFVEGLGNEVFYGLVTLILLILTIFYLLYRNRHAAFEVIHPAQQTIVDHVRGHIERFQGTPTNPNNNNSSTPSQQTQSGHQPATIFNQDDNCPICFNQRRYAVLNNCGHLFCGRCILAFWHHGSWLGAINCPVCRRQVTLMLDNFIEAELDDPEREEVLTGIRTYNRRVSGVILSYWDYLRDVPILLPHLISQFFSANGLMLVFRIRIAVCIGIAILYLLSPLDIIPEAVFGVVGILDDIFVLCLISIYLSIFYRQFMGREE